MPLYERRGNWEYRFSHAGRRYSGTTDLEASERNRKRAQAVEDTKRAEVLSGLSRKVRGVSFADAAAAFEAHVRGDYQRWETARRILTSLASLRAHFGGLSVSALDAVEVEGYKTWRRENGIADVTLRHDLHNLSLFFQFASRRGWAAGNPVEDVRIPSDRDAIRIHVLAAEEERRYFAVIERGSNLWDVSRLVLLQGMRPGEVMSLQRRDVDPDAGVLFVRQGKTAAARRTVYLVRESIEIVRRRLQQYPDSRWLFPSKRAGRVLDIPLSNLRASHERALRDCGLSFVLYDLRHTFATRAAEAGVDLPTLAALLGHSGLSILTRYVHPTGAHQERAMSAIDAASRRLRKLA